MTLKALVYYFTALFKAVFLYIGPKTKIAWGGSNCFAVWQRCAINKDTVQSEHNWVSQGYTQTKLIS